MSFCLNGICQTRITVRCCPSFVSMDSCFVYEFVLGLWKQFAYGSTVLVCQKLDVDSVAVTCTLLVDKEDEINNSPSVRNIMGGNIWEFGIPGTMGLFFFTIGAVASINQLSIFTIAKKMKFCGWVYPLLAAIDIMTKGEVFNIYIHNVGILSGMVLVVYGLGKWLERKDSAKPNEFLLASTFFVFACHSPYNGKLVHVMLCVLPSLSSYKLLADIQCILYYFLTATAWILILLSVFAMIKKMSPKTAIFLSGGR